MTMSPDIERVSELALEAARDGRPVERAAALIALALIENAKAVRYAAFTLGTADAATPMGALEALGAAIRQSGDAVAAAIQDAGRE